MAISQLSFNLYSNTIADKLGDMAAKVATQNMDLRYATFVFFNSTLYYSVEVFLQLYTNNVIVNMGTFNPNLAKRTKQFVLFGSDVDDVEQILDAMSVFEIHNTGKFLIICESSVSNQCDEMDIMEMCSYYRIVDVVFIKQEEEKAVGYTYYPISDDICDNKKPVKLNVYEDHINTTYGEVYGKKYKNLKTCPLTVSTFIQTPYMNITNGTPIGADGDLLRIIAYGLNSSLVMMTPHRGYGWGWRYDNGTWMGSLADIKHNMANLSMTSAALTLSRFSDFQISTSYYTSKVVWVAHPAQMQNVALKLLHPFKEDIRIALGASFLLVILCALLIKTYLWMSICHFTEVENEPMKSIVFYAWMICMGQAIIKLPTKSSFLQITFIWIWYCFLVRTVYQVYLISSLKGKFYEDPFETIEDVISAKYAFGGGAALKDYYIDNPIVYDNWMNVDSPQIFATALNISKGMKFVLAMNQDTAKLIIKQRKVALHILPQTIVTSPTVLFFKKYSPLLESIDLILKRLSASGLPEKLHQMYTTSMIARSSNDEEQLKIVHFTACYIIMIFGWILSAIFFLLEIYFGKIYRHRHPAGAS